MSAPAPVTLNVLPFHEAPPDAPTAPTSAVLHPAGSGCADAGTVKTASSRTGMKTADVRIFMRQPPGRCLCRGKNAAVRSWSHTRRDAWESGEELRDSNVFT